MQSSLGSRGEELAARHLERRGWAILARNLRSGRKEVDLVARRGRVVIFVEVKTRRNHAFGHPLEAITPHKRREIEEVAAAWIASNGLPDLAYRFDAIAILWPPGESPRIEHIEDAWGT